MLFGVVGKWKRITIFVYWQRADGQKRGNNLQGQDYYREGIYLRGYRGSKAPALRCR